MSARLPFLLLLAAFYGCPGGETSNQLLGPTGDIGGDTTTGDALASDTTASDTSGGDATGGDATGGDATGGDARDGSAGDTAGADTGGPLCSCDGRQCGDDGCGGSCGACTGNDVCNALGQCVDAGCVPDCAAAECGPDPVCGVTCGDCPAGTLCSTSGQCECAPTSCAALGAECGQADDGCGELLSCGDCDAPQSCGGGGLPNACGGECLTGADCGDLQRCEQSACVSACTVAGAPGWAVTVDVPSVDTTISFTLGGAPLPEVSSPSGGYWSDSVRQPTVLLHSTDRTGDVVTLYPYTFGLASPAFDWVMQGQVESRSLIPGRYRVEYRSGQTDLFGSQLPINSGHTLSEALEITGGSVTIDIPKAVVSADFSVNGDPLPAISSPASGYWSDSVTVPRVRLHGTSEGSADTVDLYPYRMPADPDYHWVTTSQTDVVVLIPGTYRVEYRSGERDIFAPHLPVNASHTLLAAQPITGGPITLDIPKTVVSIGFSLNGGPLPQIASPLGGYWSSSVSPPRVRFSAGGDGATDEFTVYPYQLPSDPDHDWLLEAAATDIVVIPGSYRAVYVSGQTDLFGAHLPINRAHTLSEALTISGSALTVDIPMATPTIGFTLNGATPPTFESPVGGYWSASVKPPRVRFHGPSLASEDRFDVLPYALPDDPANEWTLTPATTQVRIIPGTYRTEYLSGSTDLFGDDLPVNSGHTLAAALVVADGALTVDIPKVVATLDVSVNGAPLPSISSPSGGYWSASVSPPRIRLDGLAWGSTDYVDIRPYAMPEHPDYDWVLGAASVSLALIPGAYRVEYYSGQTDLFGAHLPVNAGHTLQASMIISAGPHEVDIPMVHAAVDVRLNGATWPPIESPAAGYWSDSVTRPRLRLYGATDGSTDHIDVFPYRLPSDPGFDWVLTPTATTVGLIPGTYRTEYRSGQTDLFGGALPVNNARTLGCVQFLSP